MTPLYMVRNKRTGEFAKGVYSKPLWDEEWGRTWTNVKLAKSWCYKYNTAFIWYKDEPTADPVEVVEFELQIYRTIEVKNE